MPKRNDEQKLITSIPTIGLLLFPFIHHYEGVDEKNYMKTKRIDATSSVKSITYQKSKSEPSGTFSITLTSDQNWTQIVRPGDWLMLYQSAFAVGVKGPGQDTTEGLRCLGNIDRVSRQKTITQNGQKIFTYRIDGRDFGKVFEKIKFYYNPYIPKGVQDNFVMLRGGIKITGTPSSFVRSYCDLYLGSGTIIDEGLDQGKGDSKKQKIEELDQLKIPQQILKIFGVNSPKGNLFDILMFNIPGEKDELGPLGYSWSIPPDRSLNGSLWDILVSVSNSTMNEIFLSMQYYPETQQVRPTLTFRKQPWAKKNFSKLPHIVVQEDMIITDDVGFNDHERTNWLNLDPRSSFIANYPQFMAASAATIEDKNDATKQVPLFPYINTLSVKRYGTQQRTLDSEFIQVTEGERKEGSQKTDLQLAEEWMRELIAWWSDFERYESGTILAKGFSEQNKYSAGPGGREILNNNPRTSKPIKKVVSSDQYNIGNNIYLNSRERLYHLEGFSLEWNAPGESHVTFAVTRGVYWAGGGLFKFVDEKDSEDQVELSVGKIVRK